jgi:hypothetical protein
MNYKDFVKIDRVTKNQCLELKEVGGKESKKYFNPRHAELILDNDPKAFAKFIKDTLYDLFAIKK